MASASGARSVHVFKDVDGVQECAHGDTIILGLADLFCLVVQGVELTWFERVANLLKQNFDRVTVTQLLEVGFADANVGGLSWIHEIDGLGLISVVLVISNAAPDLEGHIGSDGWDTE